GGSTSGGTTSSSGAAVKVTAVIDPYDPPTVVTYLCPYQFVTRATISVSKGPIDLKYVWLTAPGSAPIYVVHFDVPGPQSKVVTRTSSADGYGSDVGLTLRVMDEFDKVVASPTRTFRLTCSVRLGMVQYVPPTQCPYDTDFTITLSAGVRQHVTY